MLALIDGDILRYEVGFGAEAWWRDMTKTEDIPPWDFVADLLQERIRFICAQVDADDYQLFISEGQCFRYKVAKTVPYKSRRVGNKPWHYDNLTMYMKLHMDAIVSEFYEADDMMAMLQCRPGPPDTIICSRDKDLRQVNGWFYSWEIPNANQPSFGPIEIKDPGTLELTGTKVKKLRGTGYKWFCAQMLTGDSVDSIPGLPGWGPVAAEKLLSPIDTNEELLEAVQRAYAERMGDEWEEYFEEQRQLVWIVR